MQANWFEGHVVAEFSEEGSSNPFPIQIVFTNNGIMSVTVGNETFRPSPNDLAKVASWAQAVAVAMTIPDEQVFVGAYRSQVSN